MSDKPKIIQEYFVEKDNNKVNHFDEMFNPNKDNIDVQTEVTDKEIKLISTLKTNDEYLKKKIGHSVFDKYIKHFLRLKISKDRQSRAEYVDVNKQKEQDVEGLFSKMGVGGSR